MLEAIILAGLVALVSLFPQNPAVIAFVCASAVLLLIQFLRLGFTKAPPFIPTDRAHVRSMVRLADIKPGEIAWDLGCGDGRFVRAAAAEGAVATGFELSFLTYLLAKILSLRTKNVYIRFADFWSQPFEEADVIFCFLLKQSMSRFQREVWPRLKPGTRVVSYMFRMPDVAHAKRAGNAYLYVR